MTIHQIKTKAFNKSGITPVGDRVIVKPDIIKEGLIEIPDAVKDKHMDAQAIGTFIAAGPDAWIHRKETIYDMNDNGGKRPAQEKIIGYTEPFAKPGDRVAFAKYGGLPVTGEDGEKYRILNDEDITAQVSNDVSFTDLETRRPVGS